MRKNRIVAFFKNCWRIRKLLEIERMFQLLDTLLPSSVFKMDSNGYIIYANKAALKIFGYPKEILGKLHVTEVIIPEQKEEFLNNFQKLKNKPERNDIKYTMLCQNGNTFPAIILARSIKKRGEFTGTLGIVIDHTEYEKRKKELEKMNTNKDQFFSIIAHDLKSPLSSIAGLLELLADDEENLTSEERKKIIVTTKNSSKAVLNLLANLLTWAKLQFNNSIPNIKVANLAKELEITMATLISSSERKRIIVNQQIPFNLQVMADIDMLQTIWRNLITNAIKFTPSGNQIFIRANPKGNSTEIIVEDTGVGMTAEILDNLFKPEMIMSVPGTNNEKGTGLGLLICQEMIQKMRGELWAESKPGKGSKFCFTLPSA